MAWELADNIRGPKGDKGDAGTIGAAAAKTLPAGSAATVELSGSSADRFVLFGIPKGDRGEQGVPGTLSSASAESVPAGDDAQVIMSGTTEVKHAHFRIPRGLPGVNALENDAAVAAYVAAEDSDTRAALDKAYRSGISVLEAGASGDGEANDLTPILNTIASAVAFGVKVVSIPAGEYYVPGDIQLPRDVTLVGAGMNATVLKGRGTDRLLIKGGGQGVGADWGGPSISNLTFHGMGVVFGDTETDWGNGASMQNVEIRYTTVGLTLRYNTFSFRGQNLRIHQCSVAGIKHDFAPVAAGSGSNISYSQCMVFNCPDAGFWQNGAAVDGCHVTFTETNIEHCGVSYRIKGITGSGSVFEIFGGHFEGNNTSYIESDSGTIFIHGCWAFELATSSTTKVALFDLSGTSRLWLLAGRVSWSASSRLYRMTGTSQFIIDTASTVLPQVGMGTEAPGSPATADSTVGAKLKPGIARTSQASVAVSHGTPAPIATSHAFDATTYEVEWFETFTGMGANNTLFIYVRSATGGVSFSPAIPDVATSARVRVVFAPLYVYAEVLFSTGAATVHQSALTHTPATIRFLETTVGGSGTATATVFNRVVKAL